MISLNRCEEAVLKGLEFLRQRQLPTGEFATLAGPGGCFPEAATYDSLNFTTMHIANSLLHVGSKQAVATAKRAGSFLVSQMLPGGLWRFWSNEHPGAGGMPADTDDTACITDILRRLGFYVPDNRSILMANRNREGLFYTWILPRPRHLLSARSWPLLSHSLARIRRQSIFFRSGAEPPDRKAVGAVVNANALLVCGESKEATRVTDWIISLVDEGRVSLADRWYQSQFALFYAIARCVESGISSATPLASIVLSVIRATDHAKLKTFDCSQMLCAALAFGETGSWLDYCASQILSAQQADGSWCAAPHYYGGYARARAWGSSELTTGFCVEALSRYSKMRT